MGQNFLQEVQLELIQAQKTLTKLLNPITIFGSSREKEREFYYQKAYELSGILSYKFPIITGAGPGIMEASNRGAYEKNNLSIGLGIELEEEQKNQYISDGYYYHFHYFFTRKYALIHYSGAFIFFPGGVGTLDEFFETLVLIATNKKQKCPLICFGVDFWLQHLNWVQEKMLSKYHYINEDLFKTIHLFDSVSEIKNHLFNHFSV